MTGAFAGQPERGLKERGLGLVLINPGKRARGKWENNLCTRLPNGAGNLYKLGGG